MMDAPILARCTGATLERAQRFAQPLTDAMHRYAIDTPIRQAMFLANVGHESGRLQFTTELWGPTPTQRQYEGRADLGNVKPGDGSRYRGHGLLQTTGRANHVAVRDRLRRRFPAMGVPDFEADPPALALPAWAALSAADYWDMRKINQWADMGDFDGVCDLINRGRKTAAEGDSNGWIERAKLYVTARKALGMP
jgi:putative chitinase